MDDSSLTVQESKSAFFWQLSTVVRKKIKWQMVHSFIRVVLKQTGFSVPQSSPSCCTFPRLTAHWMSSLIVCIEANEIAAIQNVKQRDNNIAKTNDCPKKITPHHVAQQSQNAAHKFVAYAAAQLGLYATSAFTLKLNLQVVSTLSVDTTTASDRCVVVADLLP